MQDLNFYIVSMLKLNIIHCLKTRLVYILIMMNKVVFILLQPIGISRSLILSITDLFCSHHIENVKSGYLNRWLFENLKYGNVSSLFNSRNSELFNIKKMHLSNMFNFPILVDTQYSW